ncbi:MAG: CDP-alcohol phosphatidyltransferase family protein [Pirellulales bacterium]|nr:CDP-alcohol phosphatidyltransferase family protein [Pirellulales bacterium]
MSAASHENRRPLKSRQWAVFQGAAAWLARIGVSPNAISLSSIAFAVAAGASFAATAKLESDLARRAAWTIAALFVQLRLYANLLDGLVAVEGGRGSPVGDLYNEVPDRVADTAILLGAGYAAGSSPALGAAASIVAVFTAYCRALGASLGGGQVFIGPMAKPQRMALITAIAFFYAFTPRAWQAPLLNRLHPIELALWAIVIGGLITAFRRLKRTARHLTS